MLFGLTYDTHRLGYINEYINVSFEQYIIYM